MSLWLKGHGLKVVWKFLQFKPLNNYNQVCNLWALNLSLFYWSSSVSKCETGWPCSASPRCDHVNLWMFSGQVPYSYSPQDSRKQVHVHLSHTYMWFIPTEIEIYSTFTLECFMWQFYLLISRYHTFIFFLLHCCLLTELGMHRQQESTCTQVHISETQMNWCHCMNKDVCFMQSLQTHTYKHTYYATWAQWKQIPHIPSTTNMHACTHTRRHALADMHTWPQGMAYRDTLCQQHWKKAAI